MAKRPAPKAQPIEVLEPEQHPDQALIETDGANISGFIRNIAAFFRTAGELEAQAKQRLMKAKTLAPPTSADEDEGIQRFIKETTRERKAVEDHWGICQTFSQVHRKLTAGRGRTVTLYEDAAAIAQRLHNDYAEAERRRAQIEQDRQRREAERQATADRARELATAEEQALRLEAVRSDLSEREQTFVAAYVHGIGAAGLPEVAAARAGYKDPSKQAARLLTTPKITSAIQAKRDAIAIREQAEALKQQPLNVRTEVVKPNLSRASGAVDRTTHSAALDNEGALIAACIAGGYGIPHDILRVDTAKLNEYARSLQERINLWPGVRHVKKTTTV